MLDESRAPSPENALIALSPPDSDWQPIFHASNQVVLYNPTSHALSIRKASHTPHASVCPYCNRPFPQSLHPEEEDEADVDVSTDHAHASNYFQLLAMSNEVYSRPSTPPTLTSTSSSGPSTPNGSGTRARANRSRAGSDTSGFAPSAMAQGYFARFFKEEDRLGMGANGTVYLCQHVLDNNPLGYFAVKKIAVGDSHSYLLTILREIRLLERLHHPNIITYHHSWLEMARFSSFGMEVPTVHVLMQYASGGSLDDFISARLGNTSTSATSPHSAAASRSARIRAFRERKREREQEHRMEHGSETRDGAGNRGNEPGAWKAVHLLSAEEVRKLFGDVVEGLGFLHDKSILHLDLKPGNVLLTYDDGQLIPRAMLSDFGTSRDMLHSSKARSGNTGTLEYTSPESLPSPQTGLLHEINSKADMWSLGMLLHKMLFFKLPYKYVDADEGDGKGRIERLEREVLSYPGFKFNTEMATAFVSRRLSRAYLFLLEKLLNPKPAVRPSCERVLSVVREGSFDPLHPEPDLPAMTSLIPAPRWPRSVTPSNESPVHNTQTLADETVASQASPHEEPFMGTASNHSPQPTRKLKEALEGDQASVPLLGLPPVEMSRWGDLWLKMTGMGAVGPITSGQSGIPGVLWVRTVKSCFLVVKVLTIMSTCSDFGTGSHPVIVCVLLVLAVIDTLFDGIRITVVLGVAHFGLLWLGCQRCNVQFLNVFVANFSGCAPVMGICACILGAFWSWFERKNGFPLYSITAVYR